MNFAPVLSVEACTDSCECKCPARLAFDFRVSSTGVVVDFCQAGDKARTSHKIATQPCHSDRAGQGKMASIEFWIPCHNVHGQAQVCCGITMHDELYTDFRLLNR